jgi:hypothetical protein
LHTGTAYFKALFCCYVKTKEWGVESYSSRKSDKMQNFPVVLRSMHRPP